MVEDIDLFKNDETRRYENGKLSILHPVSKEFYPVINVEEEIMEVSQRAGRSPEDVAFAKAFRERRLSQAQKIAETQSLAAFVPPPGGAGYGMVYRDPFRTNYTHGTAIFFIVICPITPGSGVSDFLYLTATNRAAKGCEALVSYYGNTRPLSFGIWDWGMPDPNANYPPRDFIIKIPYSQLGGYLHNLTIDGASRPCLQVLNTTHYINSTTWGNTVSMYVPGSLSFYQIYSSTYQATLSSQQIVTGPNWWGPIIETFQNSFTSATNVMGFANTMLNSCDQNGNWTTMSHLSTSQSTDRNDSLGFVEQFLSPNYTWGAKVL